MDSVLLINLLVLHLSLSLSFSFSFSLCSALRNSRVRKRRRTNKRIHKTKQQIDAKPNSQSSRRPQPTSLFSDQVIRILRSDQRNSPDPIPFSALPMTRRCSHCSHNGHNSRTCPNRGVKLFGVRLTDGSIRKSASMGNLTHYAGSGSGLLPNNPDSPGDTTNDHATADGYASEDFVPGSSSSRERKKGTPWTEEEHRMFLLGLQKLGKGDWRGIARNYVISRTPTQVASHAQKYFIRQTNVSRRKRRSSLFDIVADDSVETQMEPLDLLPGNYPEAETQSNNPLPAPPPLDEECESMDSTNSDGEPAAPNPDTSVSYYPMVYPAYFSPFPIPYPLWSGYTTEPTMTDKHEVLKPTAIHSKSPINVDELVGMSKLSLGEPLGHSGPSSLTLKMVEGSSRQSAFHANPGSGNSSMNSGSSPIHAV